MTESELFLAMTETSALLSQDFEFFITATFALIVVAYAVGDRLTLLPRILISALYLASVAMFLFRYMYFQQMFVTFRAGLLELNSELVLEADDWSPSTALRLFIYVAGSLATVFSMFRPVILARSEVEGDRGA